jgi:hypothetical protein
MGSAPGPASKHAYARSPSAAATPTAAGVLPTAAGVLPVCCPCLARLAAVVVVCLAQHTAPTRSLCATARLLSAQPTTHRTMACRAAGERVLAAAALAGHFAGRVQGPTSMAHAVAVDTHTHTHTHTHTRRISSPPPPPLDDSVALPACRHQRHRACPALPRLHSTCPAGLRRNAARGPRPTAWPTHQRAAWCA